MKQDDEFDAEALVIAQLKAAAEPHGLWNEVKQAYDSYRRAGDDPKTAAFSALYDWDL